MQRQITPTQPAPAPTAPARIVTIRTLDALEPWIPGWDALAEEGLPGRPMHAGSWVAAHLETMLRKGTSWTVTLLTEGDRVCAAWPMVRSYRWGLRHMRGPCSLHTLSTGPVTPCGGAASAALSRLLTEGVARTTSDVVSDAVVRNSDAHRALLSFEGKTRRIIERDAQIAGARIDVTQPYEVLWRRPSSKTRQRLKTARRRLEALGVLSWHFVTGAEAIDAVEAFLAMENAGWKGRDGTAILHDEPITAFYRALARRLAGTNRLRVNWLQLNGEAIAGELCVQFARTLFVQKITFAEAHERLSPGHVLWADTLAAACDDPDLDRVDTIGTDQIRQRWHCEPYDYVNVHAVRRTLLATVMYVWPLRARAWLAARRARRASTS